MKFIKYFFLISPVIASLSSRVEAKLIGTIQAQSNESPYIKVGINKPSSATKKETTFVENEKKPIIGTKKLNSKTLLFLLIFL